MVDGCLRRSLLIGDTLAGDLGVVVAGNPLGGGNGVDLLAVHCVNLLEGAVLGLDDEEEDNEDEGSTTSGVDETVEVVNGISDEASEETNEEVEEPVGGSGDSHAARSVLRRVHLGDDSPDKGTPGGSEGDNGQARESNENGTGGGSALRVVTVESEVTNEGVDEEAHHHPGGTDHERDTATTLLDDIETAEGTESVDRSENELGDVRVLETSGSKDGGTEVEEEVDTSELLTGLENNTEDGTVHHAVTSEDLNKAGLGQGALLLKLLTDLIDLAVDTGGVGLETSKASDVVASFILLTLSVGESRRLGEEENANTEKKGPEEVEAVGNSPRGAAVVVVGTPVDHLSAPNTEGDHELVARNDDTSDDGRSRLGLVHGDSDGQRSDTDTSDETTDSMLVPSVLRSDFDDSTDTGPEGGSRDGHATTDGVAKVTGNQSTNQTSNREKTSDCSLSSSAEFVVAVSVGFAKAGAVVVHEEVSRDLTTSITK